MGIFRANPSLCWLATLLLLLGTAAPALERLSCSMGCPTTVGFGEVEDCCAEGHHEQGPSLFADDCCDVERAAPEHQAFTTPNGKVTLPVPFAFTVNVEPPPTSSFVHVATSYETTTHPPPLLGGARLSRIGTFLI